MPVVAGRVIVLVPAMLAEDNVIVPEVAPFNFIDLPELKDKCSDEVHDEVEETQLIVLSVSPLRVMPPPSADMSVGLDIEPSSIFLSSTEIVVEFIVVVVPLTVRFPESVISAAESVPVNVGLAKLAFRSRAVC